MISYFFKNLLLEDNIPPDSFGCYRGVIGLDADTRADKFLAWGEKEGFFGLELSVFGLADFGLRSRRM